MKQVLLGENLSGVKAEFDLQELRQPYEHKKPDFDPRSVNQDSLAYVLGVLVGDGYITGGKWWESHHYYIRLQTKDRDFAEVFAKHLGQILGRVVPIRDYHRITNRGMFRGYDVVVGDKSLFLWLRALGRQQMLCFAVDPLFLRGLFDSECTVSKDAAYIRLYNKDVNMLKRLAFILDINYDLHAIIHTYNYMCPFLVINGRLQLIRFLEKIGLSIGRKQSRLLDWRDKY